MSSTIRNSGKVRVAFSSIFTYLLLLMFVGLSLFIFSWAYVLLALFLMPVISFIQTFSPTVFSFLLTLVNFVLPILSVYSVHIGISLICVYLAMNRQAIAYYFLKQSSKAIEGIKKNSSSISQYIPERVKSRTKELSKANRISS